MELFYPDEELEKAPLIIKEGEKIGNISVSKGRKYIYVRALAKNGYYLDFQIEEIRLLNGEYTAVLKPKNYRKSPWRQLRKYRDIIIQEVVIPKSYKDEVLSLLNAEVEQETRRRAKNTTPQGAYRLPILEALAEMGGRGEVRDVRERVYEKMKDVLTKDDKDYLPSGKARRWDNKMQWERLRLVKEGYLRKDSPYGIWELTDKGWRYLREMKRKE
ncbi:winged helix-turn-helix domain-containing protein [bacterium]|nr:winged helix-turn-helix domain-containing protein [bacterium]